jgi:hypothetical protein
MESVITKALHYALSVLNEESHAAVVFMLDDRYGVKMHGFSPVNVDDIRAGLQDIFGQSADILINRINEYLFQHAKVASTINVSGA